jgi:hypothetical protein
MGEVCLLTKCLYYKLLFKKRDAVSRACLENNAFKTIAGSLSHGDALSLFRYFTPFPSLMAALNLDTKLFNGLIDY